MCWSCSIQITVQLNWKSDLWGKGEIIRKNSIFISKATILGVNPASHAMLWKAIKKLCLELTLACVSFSHETSLASALLHLCSSFTVRGLVIWIFGNEVTLLTDSFSFFEQLEALVCDYWICLEHLLGNLVLIQPVDALKWEHIDYKI